MLVPIQVLDASDWRVADYGQARRTSQPAAGGVCSVTFAQVPDGELWLVDRIVVSATSTSYTRALVYDGPDGELRDGSDNGNLDVGDMASPIQLAAGDQLHVAWDGCSANSVGTAHAQWTVLRRP